MKYCESEGCSGLGPCEACTQVRRAILMRAVQQAGLTKETAEKFFHAYAEAFDMAMVEIQKIQQATAQKRLEEKEAREKKPGRAIEKEGRDKKTMGAKPLVKGGLPRRLAQVADAPTPAAENGVAAKKNDGAGVVSAPSQHHHANANKEDRSS